MVALDVGMLEAPDFGEEDLDREEVLTRYRRLRALFRDFENEVIERVPRKVLLAWGKRLGIVRRKTFVAEAVEEMTLVADLAIHTPRPGKIAPIERYRRMARFPPESDEACLLEAMCRSRLTIFVVERRHAAAGLVMRDLFRNEQIWLVDEGLEATAQEGMVLASRVTRPDLFHMTTGVAFPMGRGIPDAFAQLPFAQGSPILTEGRDARLVTAIYRIAVTCGLMKNVIAE